MSGSDSSTTPEFAFAPPSMAENSFDLPLKTPNYNPGISPSAFTPNGTFNINQYPSSMAYSSGSSFSSSASAAGTSFSSIDALPAISREFARPTTNETRRPATANGALQSFGSINGRMDKLDKPETIEEVNEGMFTDPFGEKGEQIPHMDPHYIPAHRRASEPQFNALNIQSSWPQAQSATPEHSANPSPHNHAFPMASAPVTGFGLMPGASMQMQQLNRAGAMAYGSRPQTSDGIPSYGSINPSGVSLPSARTIANQIESPQSFVAPQAGQFYGNQTQPYRDNRAASLGDVQQQYQPGRHYPVNHGDKYDDDGNDDMTFVPLGGSTHGGPSAKKRPRRRYDEIERLYGCGWNGCEKSYGTLNHLNAHVAMQKHGEKRLPTGEFASALVNHELMAEFKDMRKAWRKKKRDQAAAAANAQYMATTTTWNPRQSISSSESDYDRRDSNVSAYSAGTADYSSHRGSLVYSSGGYPAWHDSSRPTTSSSVTSSADGRFPVSVQGGYAHGMIGTVPAVRRPSAPNQMPMPSPNGFRFDDHPTPTQQNPFPHPGHPMHQTHPSHPHQHQAQRPMSQGQMAFGSLTAPMPMPMMAGGGMQGSQFAFQR